MSTLAYELRNAAHQARERGLSVFPLVANSKRPLLRGWQQRATADRSQIEQWWNGREHNVGIACGPSGLLVIDLDRPKAEGQHHGRDVLWDLMTRDRVGWTQTYTVLTPNDGVHLYYRAPAGFSIGNSVGQVGQNIDIRAAGGFVVAAGSVIDGNPYIVNNNLPVADLPEDLFVLLMKETVKTHRRVPASRVAVTGDPEEFQERRIREATDEILSAPEGQRNNCLNGVTYRLARLCGAHVLDTDRITQAMYYAGLDAGLSEREVEGTVRSAMTAGMAKPRALMAVPDLSISA
jgi:hypothetical protein